VITCALCGRKSALKVYSRANDRSFVYDASRGLYACLDVAQCNSTRKLQQTRGVRRAFFRGFATGFLLNAVLAVIVLLLVHR